MEFQIDHFKLWDKYLNDKNTENRKTYFQEVPLKMRGKIWDDFVVDVKLIKTHVDFFDWWKIVKGDYVKKQEEKKETSTSEEKEINASTSQNKTWKKSRDETIENSTYPPFEEIEISWNGAKIITAPFKEVNGNSDLEKIKSQNNYTNQILQVMSH